MRIEPEPEPKFKYELELKETEQERPLNNIFYPPRTTFPLCFNLPDLRSKVTFDLRPHYTQILPKFTSLEDAFFFGGNLKKYVP